MDHVIDPDLRSWVPVPAGSDFPIQNLPFGVFRPGHERPRVGIAIGDRVLDLAVLHETGRLDGTGLGDDDVFARDALNDFMALGRPAWRAVRRRAAEILESGNPELRDDGDLRDRALHPAAAVEMLLPARIGDYTDFYSSIEHATNMGKMFRDPDKALLPNWRHIPVGYNGRAGSVVVSGTGIRRPRGQTLPEGADSPVFGPSRVLDFELEMGFFTGPGNRLGEPIPVAGTPEHIFGMVLVNDWSARDIQRWEYVPLGPFLAKSFGTSVSPWVVTLDALEPFRKAGPRQEPPVLPYLRPAADGAYDIRLEAWLEPAGGGDPVRLTATGFGGMYWSIFQQLAHQTVNGTNVRPGDLYASGTVSGSEPGSYGSLLELTWRGTRPIPLPGGGERKFLADGDAVVMKGWCEREGLKIGFGEVRGRILPATPE